MTRNEFIQRATLDGLVTGMDGLTGVELVRAVAVAAAEYADEVANVAPFDPPVVAVGAPVENEKKHCPPNDRCLACERLGYHIDERPPR